MNEAFRIYPYTVDEFKNILVGNSGASLDLVEEKSHIAYLDKYFQDVGTKIILVEYDYVDRDFLEDFAGFYARCFPDYNRKCTRLHFFSYLFTAEQFKCLLANPNTSDLTQDILQEHYLGFMVVKPLPQTIIGRTCISTYPNDNNRRHFPIIRQYKTNLFGLCLSVRSLAFQEQDEVAAACATSALWTVFHGTGMQFQHSIPSPVEITKKAFSNFPLATRVIPNPTRVFPNSGLSAEMMAQAIRDIGLEPFLVPLAQAPQYLQKAHLYAYLRCGIPVIFGFDIVPITQTNPEGIVSLGKHAVAATGYSLGLPQAVPYSQLGFLLKASRMDKVYVHDDQVGPFARMEFDGSLIANANTSVPSISTSWGEGANRACSDLLLVPLYHKIRIPFQPIHDAVLHFDCSFIEQLKAQGKLPSITQRLEWDIYLTTINRLKRDLFSDAALNEEQRQEILLKSFPRFLWRATAFHNNDKVLDLLFDATDIVKGQFFICAIEYSKEISDVFRETAKEASLARTFQTTPGGKILEWFRNQPVV
ncbi:hypothetical protein [Pantanalinema sp. GBBB05]|uniref:hypothetical protein n=1 Tax=Pantanalinema sp. GBBB05 TaxID=2604139 RepID=UPI001D878C49|nr:hypothetical protein [Pantanalinema sp. GBBB05]